MPDGAHFDSAAMASDCPMGYVCPMRFGSVDFTAAQPPITGLFAFAAALMAGMAYLAFNGFQTAYTPPFSVAYNSGPPVIRSTVKRE